MAKKRTKKKAKKRTKAGAKRKTVTTRTVTRTTTTVSNPSPKHKKYIGVIGDVNPIEHQGGIIFDQGYGPQMTYFQSWYNDDTGEYQVTVSTFDIEENVLKDLDWVDWKSVADTYGMSVEELKGHATSDNIFARASVYEAVGGTYGFQNLDSYPQEMTLKQAEGKFGRAVDAAHKAEQKARSKRTNNPIYKLVVTAPSENQARAKGRRFGRIIDVESAGHGKYHVTVDQRSLNPEMVTIRRKGYTTKRGVHVKPSRFKVKDRGRPGVRSFGAKSASGKYRHRRDMPPLITGETTLGGPGYTKKSVQTRHHLLNQCVDEFGYRSCLSKLQALLISTAIKPATRRVLEADKKWLMKKYGGPGTFGPRKGKKSSKGGRKKNPSMREIMRNAMK